MTRLDARTALPAVVRGPGERPRQVGIVHLGIGAFHRAHQAVLTEDAAAAGGDDRWGILGVTQRSDRVVHQLRPQDGLYGVLTLGELERSLRVVGSVLDAVFPGHGGEVDRVLGAIAAPTTHVVTLTITEKGYARRPDGALDVDAVRGDLDAAARALRAGTPADDGASEPPAASAVGLLVRGLVARHRAGGEPLTVLSCDNVAANGRVLEGLVREAVGALAGPGADPARRAAAAGLARWLGDAVTFPSSVVDRIVPATTDAHRAVARELLGADDDALVVGEPYAQWVIEDRFAGPRPAWEAAGAQLVDDVTPYEDAKLLLLNATHSLLAYAGVLAGHETMADAVRDPRLAVHARALQAEARAALADGRDAGPDLDAYSAEVLERFANPATGHRTGQVAHDGTQKIPLRWGPTLAGLASTGASVLPDDGVLLGLVAWTAFVERALRTGAPLDDPRADELRAAVASAGTPDAAVAALLALPGLLPAGLGTDPRVVDGVTRARGAVDALDPRRW